MKLVNKLFIIGMIAGLILGGFFKLIEQTTGKKVYVLLMNIDYFPIVGDWTLSGGEEFVLHMIVSVALVFVIYFLFRKKDIHIKMAPYIIVNTLIGALLYLTTALSERTPEITDQSAFAYWLVGHMLYGFVVWLLIVVRIEKGKDHHENKQKS
ncbi:hypothetical protein [Oceanobacillus saliphilus]|uniref:hypothetical protein n=1 Tax=Oceanobacillus saliphilus TaxID=2925834 RepID=UPI00201D33D4|nr:hypothetical protein [Oceanobacillus saliphilus]